MYKEIRFRGWSSNPLKIIINEIKYLQGSQFPLAITAVILGILSKYPKQNLLKQLNNRNIKLKLCTIALYIWNGWEDPPLIRLEEIGTFCTALLELNFR